MTTDNGACQTPMADHIARAIDLMQRGARMRLDAIPGDSSMSSSGFGPDVTAEIAKRLTAPEAKSEVAVKPLEWDDNCPTASVAVTPFCRYVVWPDGALSGHGKTQYLGSVPSAKAAAQADYETRVRSALVDREADHG